MGRDYADLKEVLDIVGDLCEYANDNDEILDYLDEIYDAIYDEDKTKSLMVLDKIEACFNDLYFESIEKYADSQDDIEVIDDLISKLRQYVDAL